MLFNIMLAIAIVCEVEAAALLAGVVIRYFRGDKRDEKDNYTTPVIKPLKSKNKGVSDEIRRTNQLLNNINNYQGNSTNQEKIK